MGGILVEATGHHHPVPGDHAGMPQLPAMVGQGMPGTPGAIRLREVATVGQVCGDQGVSPFVIIDLGSLQLHLVHTDLLCQPVDLRDLVLVGAYHQELKDDMWGGTVQGLLPFDHMACALQDRLQVAFLSVLLVGFLCSAIHADDQAVQATFHRFPGPLVIQEMAISGGDGVQLLLMGIPHHLQELGMDIGLPLEVEDQVDQVAGQLVDGLPKKI